MVKSILQRFSRRCYQVGVEADCERSGVLGRTDKGALRRMAAATLKKGARITGADRNKLATDLKKQYDKGKSIRELAESHGRSYGFVHRVLSESGTSLRGRGGATRTKRRK
jgi:hypothetical protein